MVLLPAPAGPSMAMISLRWDGSVIVGMCDSTRLMRGKPRDRGVMDFDRVGTGALARPSRAKLGKLFAGVTRHSPESQALELRTSSLCCSADALGAAILGDVHLLRRSHLQQRLAPHMNKAQFPCRKQGVDCFFNSRPRNEVRQEVLDLSLIHRDHAIQIFRKRHRPAANKETVARS